MFLHGCVSWVLGIVSWVLGIVFWVLGFVFWVLGFVLHYFYTAGSRKGLAAVATSRDMDAVIKSADSAASRKTKSRGPRSRGAPRPAAVRLPSRRPGASLDLGHLDEVFLEAALAVDLITASKSKQRGPPRPENHKKGSHIIKKGFATFQTPKKRRKIE